MKASKIEWTRSTFNPWWGCEKVSPGCTNCYAEAFAKRVGQKVWGGSSPRRLFGDKHWTEPLRWNAEASKTGEPWRVFCASMADVFEDRRDLDAQRERLWALIEATPALTWLLLTKRPENMVRLAPERWAAAWPANVWAGTTVEDQGRANQRIPRLMVVPAVVRFLSIEPLLSAVNLDFAVPPCRGCNTPDNVLECFPGTGCMGRRFLWPEWVIVGTESGARARNHDDYQHHARRVIEDCRTAGVPVHHKQAAIDGRVSHDMAEWPEDLRVREYPEVRT